MQRVQKKRQTSNCAGQTTSLTLYVDYQANELRGARYGLLQRVNVLTRCRTATPAPGGEFRRQGQSLQEVG